MDAELAVLNFVVKLFSIGSTQTIPIGDFVGLHASGKLNIVGINFVVVSIFDYVSGFSVWQYKFKVQWGVYLLVNFSLQNFPA